MAQRGHPVHPDGGAPPPEGGPGPADGGPARPSVGLAVVKYTSVRLLLFVVALGICYSLGLRSLVLVLVALAVSGLLALPLARRQREALGGVIDERWRSGRFGRSGRRGP